MRKPYYKHKKKYFNKWQRAWWAKEQKRREGYVGHTPSEETLLKEEEEKAQRAAELKRLNEKDSKRKKPAGRPRPTRASLQKKVYSRELITNNLG